MIPQSNTRHTYEEFLEITKDIQRVEFIEGQIFYMSTPSVQHQKILGEMFLALKGYFKDGKCDVLFAPLDIILENEEIKNKKSVQPDIMVICDKSKYKENTYEGVPTMIIEITSPSNASQDTITKLNLYERFKVPEYWIVSPKNKSVTVYKYEDDIQSYGENTIYTKDDVVKSETFKEFSIALKKIFE